MSGHDELSGDVCGPTIAQLVDDGHLPPPTRGVISDDQMEALRERNERRAREAAKRLGTRYLLHPVHRVHAQPHRGVLR